MDIPGTIIAFPIFICISMVLLIICCRNRFKFIFTLILISFLIKGTFILFDYQYNIIPLTHDAFAYDDFANSIAQYLSGKVSFPTHAFDFEPGYTVPVGVIYWFLGHHPEIPAMINALLIILTTLNIYRLSLVFFKNERGANLAALLYSISPYLTILSCYIWRDALINYLISEIIYIMIIRAKKGERLITVPLICLTIYITLLRPENIVLLTAIIFIYYFIDMLKRRWTVMMPVKIMAVFLVVVVAGGIVLHKAKDSHFLKPFADFAEISYIGQRAERGSELGAGAYLQGVNITSWSALLLYAPLKIIYFLFVPFPWDMTKKSYIIFAADVQLLLLIYLLSIKGIRYLIKNKMRYGMILLLYVFLGIAGSAIITSNIPAAQRHRTQFTFVLFILASYSLGRIFSSKRQPRVFLAQTGPRQTGQLP